MRNLKKVAKVLILILCALTVAVLVIYSQEVKSAIFSAIVLCGKSVIPSLFSVFCITLIIVNSGATSLVPKKAANIFLFFLSMVSGYPVGAKVLSSAVNHGQLKENTATKILPSMICAGPAFIINIAGAQVFSDSRIGIRLYVCQITANFVLFIINGGLRIEINRYADCVKPIRAFIDSVKQSADSVINICAYVILFTAFSVIIAKLFGDEVSKYFIYIFEVTSAVYNSNNVYITCAVLSFSGMCVIFQVISAADNLHIKVVPLILMRIICAVLSCLLLKISFLVFPYSSPAISNTTTVPKPTMADNIPFLVVFIFSLFVLLLSISKRSKGEFIEDITG